MVTDSILKCAILDSEVDREYKQVRRKAFHGDHRDFEAFKATYGDDVTRVCRNLLQSETNRTKRTKLKVGVCVRLGQAFFVTLTFKDEVLDNTTPATRRKYVARAFKAVGLRYVANIDYGTKGQREHYHGIIEPLPFCLASWKNGKREYVDCPDFQEWTKKYGFVEISKVGKTESDLLKVAKYTTKLTRHALKKSTCTGEPKAPRLIYSRKTIK